METRYIENKKEINVLDLERKKYRITQEIKRLLQVFEGMPDNIKKTAKTLIENVAFMSVTIEDLQDEINQNGTIEEYQNGSNQWGRKKSATVDIHLAMTKNHITATKMLVDLLGKQQTQGDDGFDDFVSCK